MKKRSKTMTHLGYVLRLSVLNAMLILLATGFASGLDTSAQELLRKPVSVHFTRMDIKTALDELSSKANLKFVYTSKLVPLTRKISLKMEQKSAAEILDVMFKPDKVSYKIVNNRIVLSVGEPIGSAQINTGDNNFQTNADVAVKGHVTDDKGEGLPGVSIVLKGTTRGTITKDDGSFEVSVPESGKNILVVSYIGYITQEVTVSSASSIIRVALLSDVSVLDEMIVIGYGTTKKESLIGSVSTVSSESIKSSPVGSVSNALAGKLPGATIMQSSGEPGSDQGTIRIRGNATLGNNSPLIVVDGIPGRDLNSIHPDDIANISVLKDASAAIYGARAANGVILVTTKRGKANTPTRVDYNFYEGRLSPVKLPEMADAATYAEMIRENQSYRGVAESNMLYSEEDVKKFRSGESPWTHPNTNWYKESLRKSSITRHHNVSVSGGGEKVNYFTSFGTHVDEGIYKNSNTSFNRYNLRTNIDFKVNKYLGVRVDLSGAKEIREASTTSPMLL